MRVFKWVLMLLLVVGLGLIGYAGTIINGYTQSDDEVQLASKEAYLRSIVGNAVRQEWPNIVLVLFDDLGYADIGAFGGGAIRTPHLDRLAANGTIYTQYYSPSSVCSPSRAGLLTGRYPPRAGVPEVFHPSNGGIGLIYKLLGRNVRIPVEEILLPEVLQIAGYDTAMVGKWHLGDRSPSLPNDRGFDRFYGALYSNDMEPFALYRNKTVEVDSPVDQTRLHERYTSEVVKFVERQDESPFFLYYSHNFPHEPLHTSR
jgi:arylsulfatase A-like enzyme